MDRTYTLQTWRDVLDLRQGDRIQTSPDKTVWSTLTVDAHVVTLSERPVVELTYVAQGGAVVDGYISPDARLETQRDIVIDTDNVPVIAQVSRKPNVFAFSAEW